MCFRIAWLQASSSSRGNRSSESLSGSKETVMADVGVCERE